MRRPRQAIRAVPDWFSRSYRTVRHQCIGYRGKPPPRDRQMSKGRMSQSNRLVVLANQIREAHRDVSTLLMRSVERALTAGELLIEAKQQLSHGGWLEWLREYVEISERTA